MNRLQWVAEHQTLTAHFIDGTVNRIAWSAVPRSEMEELHRAIHRTFLVGRANYGPLLSVPVRTDRVSTSTSRSI
jgi:hypothetical protein